MKEINNLNQNMANTLEPSRNIEPNSAMKSSRFSVATAELSPKRSFGSKRGSIPDT
jgi:hypothetical protein